MTIYPLHKLFYHLKMTPHLLQKVFAARESAVSPSAEGVWAHESAVSPSAEGVLPSEDG
jgi:hypothetical protein